MKDPLTTATPVLLIIVVVMTAIAVTSFGILLMNIGLEYDVDKAGARIQQFQREVHWQDRTFVLPVVDLGSHKDKSVAGYRVIFADARVLGAADNVWVQDYLNNWISGLIGMAGAVHAADRDAGIEVLEILAETYPEFTTGGTREGRMAIGDLAAGVREGSERHLAVLDDHRRTFVILRRAAREGSLYQ